MPPVMPLLQPLFPGALAPHGDGLQCAPAPPHGAVNLSTLLDAPGGLADVLQRQARHRGAGLHDLRAVASVWTLNYLDRLLPPVVAAASVLQHALPVGAQNVWLQWDPNGTVQGFHIVAMGMSMHGTRTEERYAALLWQHLQPLFLRLAEQTRVAPKILWGNTARRLDHILAQAMARVGPGTPVAADRDFLLHRAQWPGGGNPMHGPQREVSRGAGAAPLTLHRQCCLYYLLPGESHCGACPLAPQHRRTAEAPSV